MVCLDKGRCGVCEGDLRVMQTVVVKPLHDSGSVDTLQRVMVWIGVAGA